MSGLTDQEVDRIVGRAEEAGACAVSEPGALHDGLEALVRAGALVSPLPRLYARARTWEALDVPEHMLHIMRALGAKHPDWVFCGVGAAVAHGLSVSYRLQTHIEVASASGTGRFSSRRVRRAYVDLASDEPVDVSGVRATSLARTTFDCMRTVEFGEALAIADSALRTGGLTREALVAYVDGKRTGYHGIAQARLVASLADPRSESGGESVARAVMWELGFAAPILQFEVQDPIEPGRTYRVDFCWVLDDGTLVFGELDGGEKYLDPAMTMGRDAIDVMRDERRREARLTAGQGRVVRFSMRDVADREGFARLLDTYGVPRDHDPVILPPLPRR